VAPWHKKLLNWPKEILGSNQIRKEISAYNRDNKLKDQKIILDGKLPKVKEDLNICFLDIIYCFNSPENISPS
jgi:hypothetical protein